MRHKHTIAENPGQLAGIAALAAAIGAAVAMLFTPRSGGQVRRGLKRRVTHVKEDVVQKLDGSDDELQNSKQKLQSAATIVAEDAKTTASKVTAEAKPAAKVTKPRKPKVVS